MALQDYARLVCWYNGNALVQVTSVSHVTNSGQERVNLLNEGLAGFTPGSGDCEIEIGYAVPIGGPEHTAQEDCAEGTYVTLQLSVGPLSYVGRGKILNNRINQSAAGAVEGSFSWLGELRAFE